MFITANITWDLAILDVLCLLTLKHFQIVLTESSLDFQVVHRRIDENVRISQ